MNKHRGTEVWLQSFLPSTLDENKWSTTCPGHFTPRKKSQYPLNSRLAGPQSWSGHFAEEKNSLAPNGIQILYCPAHNVAATHLLHLRWNYHCCLKIRSQGPNLNHGCISATCLICSLSLTCVKHIILLYNATHYQQSTLDR